METVALQADPCVNLSSFTSGKIYVILNFLA